MYNKPVTEGQGKIPGTRATMVKSVEGCISLAGSARRSGARNDCSKQCCKNMSYIINAKARSVCSAHCLIANIYSSGLIDFSRAVAVILSKVAALPLASRIQSTFTFRFDACEIRLGTSAGRANGCGGSNECNFQGEEVSLRFVTGFMEWLNLAVNISFFFFFYSNEMILER